MVLDFLTARADSAAGNMATDVLLLQRYPADDHARFRHYDWIRAAVTFGLSQKIADVRNQIADNHEVELCRRPTGGGVVDHRDDWTYALVLPRRHPWVTGPAQAAYRGVHQAMVVALTRCGCPAVLARKEALSNRPPLAAVCFARAEPDDVVHEITGHKLAGAAMKRTNRGLLLQGSVAHTPAQIEDWEAFATAFHTALAETLQADAVPSAWPEFPEGEHEQLVDLYSSTEWNEQR